MPQTPSRADPRSPFVFDLRELGRQPGSLREYQRRVPAPAGLGLDVIGVPEGAPLALELRLESVTEGVLVTGTVSAPISGQCARCLDPVSDELVVDARELFAYPNSATDETTGQDEVYRVDRDLIDVEPVVRDVVVLALPWTPLCRPDCGGLCSACGQRLDDLPADHAHEVIDPRWAALAAFADTAGSTDDADGAAAESTE
ncbi:MAG: YceD family protein [Jatrophihabitantaceae bacterium]